MKPIFGLSALCGLLLLAGSCAPDRREVVILSTNDMHAHIERFPRLATAVERCRDTADVILIDAGDRWTGNAYVDLAEDRRPIIELMNRLGYDLATLGNHEFDAGQPLLERSVAYANFPIICANLQASPEAELRPFEAHRILSRQGIRFGFVGVVTNYGPNNHPDGHDHIFEGLTFTDAVTTAAEEYCRIEELSDVQIALTHVGLARDEELAAAQPAFDLIIGGHSHDLTSRQVGPVVVGQSGANLKYVGVTTFTQEEDGTLLPTYRNLALSDYAPHPEYVELVAAYEADTTLQRTVGQLAAPASRIGLANLFAQSVQQAAGAEVGIYHYGGVRLDTLARGDVPRIAIYNLDPFASQVSRLEMTREQLETLIMTKFNDTVKASESHTIDLFCTLPYTVVRNAKGDAERVEFPTLKPRQRVTVAMGDYIFKTYQQVPTEQGETLPILVTDALLERLKAGPYTPQNESLQRIE